MMSEPDAVVYECPNFRLGIERPASGIVVVRLAGSDAGEFGDDPLRELDRDLADDRFDEPMAAGLDAICRGLTFVTDDDRVLEVSAVIFDGLYEQRRRSLLGGAS